jgi:Flp pilus assembly pilin Flp
MAMRAEVRLWLRDEGGAVAVEYGLLLALVSIGAIAAFQDLGLSLAGILERIGDALAAVNAKLR